MPTSITQILGNALAQVAQTSNNQALAHNSSTASLASQALAADKNSGTPNVKNDKQRVVRTKKPQVEGSFAKQEGKAVSAKKPKSEDNEESALGELAQERKGELDIVA